MKKLIVLILLSLIVLTGHTQIRIAVLNPEAENILLGSYDPENYMPGEVINSIDDITNGLIAEISTDSLQSYLEQLDQFHNRNIGSDTLSDTRGIGAARRWLLSKFEAFSAENENRLIPSFMRFKALECGMLWHKNVFAVLPGLDTTKNDIIIIEAHFDSRCEDACDTACYAPGMEDNGSGTVLVLELARIMSAYAFDHTIVFLATTGEEQGLYGAKAFASYVEEKQIPVKAVFNNDMVGGIICGNESSPPGCPFAGHIDSTHYRIFSYSFANDSSAVSPHKQLARYIKMHQEEKINPKIPTPMDAMLMIYEDRIGRGGDHTPFSDRGYPAIRIVAANENGDGSGTPPDHQHSPRDVLGWDLNDPPDGVLDTFFVDMNYLKRNCISNGLNVAYLALSPKVPEPEYTDLNTGVEIHIQGVDTVFNHYRVGVRREGADHLYFDSIYDFQNTHKLVIRELEPYEKYFFTVMNVDNGIESFFPDEYAVETILGVQEGLWHGISVSQNYPNPAKGKTSIVVHTNGIHNPGLNMELQVKDVLGRSVQNIPVRFSGSEQTITLNPENKWKGVYIYSLVIEGNMVQTRKMIFL